MRYIFLLLLSVSTLYSADPEKALKRTSMRDETVNKLFHYLFGGEAPEHLHPVVKRKLDESQQYDMSIKRISDSSSSSSDNDPDHDIKRLVLDAMHESLEELHLQAADAKWQLELKQQEVKKERYKFYAGVVGTCTALLGAIGTIVAYQASGCN